MNRDNILMLLCSQDYPPFMLESTADKIEQLTPALAKAFEDWANDGIMPEIEINGYSCQKLTEDYNMRPIAVFLALDWLIREPEKAAAALRRGIRNIKK